MKVYIWGAGNFGQYVYKQLKTKCEVKEIRFVDQNSEMWDKKVEGIIVLSPSQLEEQYQDGDVILIAFINGIELFMNIYQKPYRIGVLRNKFFNGKREFCLHWMEDPCLLWNDSEWLINKPMLHKLETNIVDGCNLNCRGCSHFSNLFSQQDKIPFATYRKDLKKIADNLYIDQFNMLGGEALLNKDIIDYIEYTSEIMPETEIILITNGLLIPKMSKDFFECCKKNDVTIAISGYKPTLKLKDSIIEILKVHEVDYNFRRDVSDFGKNIDLKGENEPEIAVTRCRENTCHFLRQGRIYKCPFEALGNKFFSHFNLNIRLSGGVDIYQDDLDWRVVANNLCNKPVDACRYCGKEERIEWKNGTEPVIEDWIV